MSRVIRQTADHQENMRIHDRGTTTDFWTRTFNDGEEEFSFTKPPDTKDVDCTDTDGDGGGVSRLVSKLVEEIRLSVATEYPEKWTYIRVPECDQDARCRNFNRC